MFERCRSELEFLLSIVDGCPDPERDVANAISELDLAERRIQAAEKLAEGAEELANHCDSKSLYNVIGSLSAIIELGKHVARFRRTLAAYRAATKEGK